MLLFSQNKIFTVLFIQLVLLFPVKLVSILITIMPLSSILESDCENGPVIALAVGR
jgi:hypothetical protein